MNKLINNKSNNNNNNDKNNKNNKTKQNKQTTKHEHPTRNLDLSPSHSLCKVIVLLGDSTNRLHTDCKLRNQLRFEALALAIVEVITKCHGKLFFKVFLGCSGPALQILPHDLNSGLNC